MIREEETMISHQSNIREPHERKSLGLTRRCDRHGSYQAKWIGEGNFLRLISICPDCEEERKRDEREEERKKRVTYLLHQSQIPKRFRSCTIRGFLGDTPAISDARDIARGYVKKFEEHKEKGRSLVFCGRPGTGKTHLACAIGLELINQEFSVRYASQYRAVRRMKCTWSKNADEDEWEVMRDYLKPDLRILDEVGVGFRSDAERVILYQIVNRRYEQVRPTILIGNLTEGELVERVGERIMDRMRDQGGVTVAFDWAGYRK